MSLTNLFSKLKGGSGSGNIGHAGIPGHRGGSAPKGILSDPAFLDWIKDEFPSNPKFLDKLKKLQYVPTGDYIGDKGAHACQTNSKNCAYGNNELHLGYVVNKNKQGEFNIFEHWFNVQDGKVKERTNLTLDEGENWKKEYHYFGLKIPDKLAKTGSYNKIDKWFNQEISKKV